MGRYTRGREKEDTGVRERGKEKERSELNRGSKADIEAGERV